MKVLQQPLGPVQANCYLVMENHHAILIDPADMYPNLEFILKENECTLEAIVLTHAHFDHISGVDKIVDVFHCDVYLNPNEFDFLQDSDLNSSSAFYMDVTCVAKCKPYLFDLPYYLVLRNADVNLFDNNGVTALMRAAYGGYPSLVEKLLAYGADKDMTDKQGNVALDYVREHCRAQLEPILR